MPEITDYLEEVPEVRLRLIPLAWALVKDDGTLDDAKVLFNEKELGEALKEAESYVRAAAVAVECLITLSR